jgi:murein L,D-transpeptidase YcbB/YkuD
MHDTPSKSLFDRGTGPLVMVVSVSPSLETAIENFKDDKTDRRKIDIAMNKKVERTYNLKPKYRVHGYTAWVDSTTVKFIFIKISMDTTSACLRYYYPTHKKANPFHN